MVDLVDFTGFSDLITNFVNICVAYQWLAWFTSQDLVPSQELLASDRGVAYQWLTWLTSQDFVIHKKISNRVCFHIWYFNS